jgi:gentisate 1,2-dioxygenase
MTQVRETLERLAAEGNGSPFDGVILEYTHPLTGGPAMPTIACYMQMLRPRLTSTARRQRRKLSFRDSI